MKKTISHSKIFFIACLFFAGGVAGANFIKLDLSYLAGSVFLIVFFLLLARKKRMIGVSLIFLLALFLGFLRLEMAQEEEQKRDLEKLFGKKITATGFVCAEPDIRSDLQKLQIRLKEITVEDQSITDSYKVLLNTRKYPQYNYGEVLTIRGKIVEPPVYETFSYKNYLAIEGIYGILQAEEIMRIDENQGSAAMLWLLNLKQQFGSKINRILPEPHASFLSGLILGAKRSMPEKVLQTFNRTGTTHIVAVSGFNITIISAFCSAVFLRFFSRRVSFFLAVVLIVGFVILTGMPASVIRAGLMGIFALLALNSGRQSSVLNLLLLSGVIMLVINPKVLLDDVGFQLSFLATAGLIFFADFLKRVFSFLPSVLEIKESLVMTGAAQILALPIIVYNFGELSILSPLANILILPVIPYSMSAGFISVILSFIYLPAGEVAAWLAWAFLSWQMAVAEKLSEISWSSVKIPSLGWSSILFYYALLLLLCLAVKNKFKKQLHDKIQK